MEERWSGQAQFTLCLEYSGAGCLLPFTRLQVVLSVLS